MKIGLVTFFIAFSVAFSGWGLKVGDQIINFYAPDKNYEVLNSVSSSRKKPFNSSEISPNCREFNRNRII